MPVDRLEFQAKVNLCSALGLLDLSMKPGLTQLGKLRNKYVHQLDYEATERDPADLVNSLKSSIGMPAQYYLRRRTECPNGFRRCVIARWLPLEMYCTPEDEAKEMVEQIVQLMAAVSRQPDEKLKKECRAEAEKFFAQRGEKMPSNLWLNTDARQAVVPRIKVTLIPYHALPPVRLFIEIEQRVGVSGAPGRIEDERESCLLLSAGYRIINVEIDRAPVTIAWIGGIPRETWGERLRGGRSGRGLGIRPARDLTPGAHTLTGRLEIQIQQGFASWNRAYCSQGAMARWHVATCRCALCTPLMPSVILPYTTLSSEAEP